MRRSFHVAIALFATIAFQEAFAAPNVAIARLRAAACCAAGCHHAGSLDDAARCCHLRESSPDVATLSRATALVPPVLVGIVTTRQPPGSNGPVSLAFAPAREVFARPAPIFLLDRSLRL
jgi:hypothetical protein